MNFDQWWAECVSEEAKRDSKAYYLLEKEDFRKLAIEAKIEDNDMDDVNYSLSLNFSNCKIPERIFRWKIKMTDQGDEDIFFEKNLDKDG